VTKAEHNRLVQKYNDLAQNYRALEAKRKADIGAIRADHAKKDEQLQQWKAWIAHNRDRLWPNSDRKHDEPTIATSVPSVDETKQPTQRTPSSQTTEDEVRSSPLANSHQSSDGVEVVSARPVKRRRGNPGLSMPPPARVKQEPNSPEKPIEFGSDELSPHLQRKGPLLRTETSDLDALTTLMRTPRRRRRDRAQSAQHERPPNMLQAVSSLSEDDEREADMPNVMPGPGDHTEDSNRRDFELQPQGQASRSNALQPLSVNVPYVAEPNRSMKRKRRSGDEIREKIAFLSEDGEMQPSQNVDPTTKQPVKSNVSRRLDSLLEGPTPDRAPLPQRPTPQTAIRRTGKDHLMNARQPQTTPSSNERPRAPTRSFVAPGKTSPPLQVKEEALGSGGPDSLLSHDKRVTPAATVQRKARRSPVRRQPAQFKRPRGLEKSPPPPEPDDEPLRSRLLDTLDLDDFKINPKYLGSDFAFADTLRGRDQRRCLQGCTRPDCCGNTFRAAVESGIMKSTKNDSQVLEEYLGPDWARITGGYDAERRAKFLVEAHAFALSNQYGKHRTAYERAKSPPGFWRTDMPSTQEEEEDRSRAREMVRQKVEERWREALRPGGRWLFRDERP